MPDIATTLAFTFAIACAPSPAAAPAAAEWWWAPVLTALLAFIAAWVAIRFDRRKTVNQELIKKRIALYDQVVPKANDMLCFYLCIGTWKQLTPTQVLGHKRELDRFINVYGGLFSPKFVTSYKDFIQSYFCEFRGRGKPAQLRANAEWLKREFGSAWQNGWEDSFAPAEERTDPDTLADRYHKFLQVFGVEIGARPKRWRDHFREPPPQTSPWSERLSRRKAARPATAPAEDEAAS